MDYSFYKQLGLLLFSWLLIDAAEAQNYYKKFDWGAIQYSFKSTFIEIEPTSDENSFTLDVAGNKEQTSFILNVFIKEIHDDQKKGIKLIFKNNWIEKGPCIVSKLDHCKTINTQDRLFFDVLKNGKQTLNIAYAAVPPDRDCALVKKPTDNLKIDFEIRGLKDENTETSKSEEEKFWLACRGSNAEVNCMQEYLRKYPKGKYHAKAKSILGYFEAQKFKLCSEEFTKVSKETIGFNKATQACQEYLVLFENGAYVSSDVIENTRKVKKILADIAELTNKPDPIVSNTEDSEPESGKQENHQPPNQDQENPELPPDDKEKPAPETNQPDTVPLEDLEWEKTQSVNTATAYRIYLEKFPDSKYGPKSKKTN